jgi:glycerol-3-phosphate dehydrogenase (NAD+)
MSDLSLPPSVSATADPTLPFAAATLIIHAVPVQYTRSTLLPLLPHIPPSTPLLSVSKGIECSSLMFMAELLPSLLGERPYAYLSGPSFAREMLLRLPTAVVVASASPALADDVSALLSSPSFRCYTSRDVVGVEVGGSAKNVIALAAGMCEGLGLGTNAMAGLVTRGCAEMRRLGIYLGGQQSTLSGLSGVGDTFGEGQNLQPLAPPPPPPLTTPPPPPPVRRHVLRPAEPQ